ALAAETINIKADKQVEWHQKDNKMVAIGNAIATKGDMDIKSDKMTGFYDTINDKSSIKTVHAVGNVIMTSPQAKAYGDTMDYDLQKDEAILKGNPAKIKTDKETISATESIIYYPSKEKAIAKGDIEIVDKDGNKIFSDNLTTFFKKSSTGSLEIDRIEINTNVKIVTKDATVTSKRGTYNPQNSMVYLYDNVTITQQNGNVLKGDKAESNLNTGISKLISTQTSGRVTGTFKEKAKEK
ncbi:MAG: LPS export ABC transporter periplasmic protein LptC, partial [Lactobacillus sp.]|nr:LPS export ABC transporter periplasmic protein LptC [Lactobacillus sp.]